MPVETTQSERLTKLETELESMKVVLLRMETKMDAWQMNFVTKELLDEKLRSRDDRMTRIEAEKTSFKNNLPFWVTAVLAALSTIIAIWPHMK